MDTNGVRLFVVTADLLNISAAGNRLGLSPAVASAKLAKLETQIGADLFHRSTRKVTLSIEGNEFLPFAREIIAQEDASLAALGLKSASVGGTLRFASSSTFAQRYITPILPSFLEKYPEINLELKLSDSQANLIEGGFDLALRNYAVEDSSLIGRRLSDDTRVLCASPDYLKKHGEIHNPEDLERHQLIVFMSARQRKLISEDRQREFMFPPKQGNPRVICDDGASMRMAAESGVGVCISSLWSIHNELEAGSLVRVLPDYHVDDNAAIWLVYPKSNVLTPKVRVFIDYLVKELGHLSALSK